MVLYPRRFRGPYITFPGIGTHSYSWEECSAFSAANAMLQFFSFYRSTRYPLLLGGQRQFCGMQGFCPITPLLVLVLTVATRRRHHHSICSRDAICEQPGNYVLTTREPIPSCLTLCQTSPDALTVAPRAPTSEIAFHCEAGLRNFREDHKEKVFAFELPSISLTRVWRLGSSSKETTPPDVPAAAVPSAAALAATVVPLSVPSAVP
jgi:hypothetical protein